MKTVELKERLIEEIKQAEDIHLLENLFAIIKAGKEEEVYQLNEEQLAAIEEAEEQIKNGETIPHSTVMDNIEKWLGK